MTACSPTFLELARQALSDTKVGYDLLAPKFEATPYATPTLWIESVLNQVDQSFPGLDTSQSRGLDLACGTGRGARVLKKYCGSVDGLDFSPGMLSQATELSTDYNGLQWTEFDLARDHLPASEYDRIVTFGAWGHILPEFREHLLEQILLSLKPGGVFCTLTANEPKVTDKRFWYYLLFDWAIKLRNCLWFGAFHMYYRLNLSSDLTQAFCNAMKDRSHFEIHQQTLTDFPDLELTLLLVRRRPCD